MVRVDGRLQSGAGHFKPRMKKFADIFREATGECLIEGTLNVKMDREVVFREHFRISGLEGDEWGWGKSPVRFEICRIDSLWAYRIKGGRGDLVAEITCAQRIPKAHGDRVELEFFGEYNGRR
jgi:hypothetical protein